MLRQTGLGKRQTFRDALRHLECGYVIYLAVAATYAGARDGRFIEQLQNGIDVVRGQSTWITDANIVGS